MRVIVSCSTWRTSHRPHHSVCGHNSQSCWAEDPKKRPSFAKVGDLLQGMVQEGADQNWYVPKIPNPKRFLCRSPRVLYYRTCRPYIAVVSIFCSLGCPVLLRRCLPIWRQYPLALMTRPPPAGKRYPRPGPASCPGWRTDRARGFRQRPYLVSRNVVHLLVAFHKHVSVCVRHAGRTPPVSRRVL